MPLANYSTDAPTRLEYRRSSDRPFYSSSPLVGYELEVAYRSDEGRERVADALQSAWRDRDLSQFGFTASRYAIHKSDGTIPSPHGAEICTVPATLEEHGRILYAAFPGGRIEANGEAPRAWGCPQVGMHVHLGLLSRLWAGHPVLDGLADAAIRPPHWGMTPLAAGKVLAFFHSPANLRFLQNLGGRWLTNFCYQSASVTPVTAWHRRAFLPWYSAAWQRRMGLSPPPPPRNVLGDVTSHALSAALTHRGTIEVRIFRSSTRVARVMMNLEFVVSVAAWAMNAGIEEAFDYRNYLRWLATTPSGSAEYPHLFKWLRRSTSPGARLFRSLYPRFNTRKRKEVA